MKLHRNLNRTALITRYLQELALALAGLALLLAFAAPAASAHGGGAPQLVNAEAGPYWVSVWTQPDPIRVGEFHVTVAVSEAPQPGAGTREAGELVLDATVLVQAAPVSQGGETLIAPATRDNAVNKLFYEADLPLPAEGPWQVDIQVSGRAGAGDVGFGIEALPPSAVSTLLGLGWPLWAGLGLVLVAAGWWTQMARHRKDEAPHA
jgi:hypothetical protein